MPDASKVNAFSGAFKKKPEEDEIDETKEKVKSYSKSALDWMKNQFGENRLRDASKGLKKKKYKDDRYKYNSVTADDDNIEQD